jgi:hypothetical protein
VPSVAAALVAPQSLMLSWLSVEIPESPAFSAHLQRYWRPPNASYHRMESNAVLSDWKYEHPKHPRKKQPGVTEEFQWSPFFPHQESQY